MSGFSTQEDPIGLAGGLSLYGYAAGDPVNFSDPFGLYAERGDAQEGDEGDPCDDDKDSEQCRKAKDEQEKRAAVCAADFAQFAAASGLEAAGVGAKDLKALWKLSRSPATWGNGAVVRSATVNFSLLPGGAALSASLGAEGGTPNPFYGRDSQIYTFASGLLVLGSGLKLGEAINSCRSAAEGKP